MKKYKQLTQEQRYQIYALMKIKYTQTKIAKQLGVSKSTISRELARNSGFRGYRPKQAYQKTLRRMDYKKRRRKLTNEIIETIRFYMEDGLSPEQISGYLKSKSQSYVSHETIYRFIKTDSRKGGRLYTYLRHSHKKKKKRYGATDKRGCIKDRVSIEQRPKIVDKKTRIGDWEIDTMVGKNHKGYLLTAVERKSKLTLICKVANKKAESVLSAVLKLFSPLKNLVFTITLDNGKEFAFHKKMSEFLDAKVYFAHPYSSWERGLNENTNGLIRQYFPKKTSFETITEKEINTVVAKLNRRPRKSLGFKAPSEVFLKNCFTGGA